MSKIGPTGLTGATGLRGLNGLKGMSGFQGATGMTGMTGPSGITGNTLNPSVFIFNSKNNVFTGNLRNIDLNSLDAGDVKPYNSDPTIFTVNSNNIIIKKNGLYQIKGVVNIEFENELIIVGLGLNAKVGGSGQIVLDVIKQITNAETETVAVSIQTTRSNIIYNPRNVIIRQTDSEYLGASLIITKLA